MAVTHDVLCTPWGGLEAMLQCAPSAPSSERKKGLTPT